MKRFVFLSWLLCLAITPAGAETGEDFWHLSNFTNPKTQRFEYCAVESGFDNGLSLALARNRDFYTNIIVGFGQPKLEAKTKYHLLVGVDGHAPSEITGFAADPKALVVPLQKDKKLLGELRTGKLLEVKGPQDAIKFSLNGAAAALDQLQDCVEKSLKEEARKVPVPASEPARKALTLLSQTAPTPGGSAAGEVEPLPLPKQIPVALSASEKPITPVPETLAALPATPVVESQSPVAQPVAPPAVVASAAPAVADDTMPVKQREPVQKVPLTAPAPSGPVPTPMPAASVSAGPSSPDILPTSQIMVASGQQATPPAEIHPDARQAEAEPAKMAARQEPALQSAPYNQIQVVQEPTVSQAHTIQPAPTPVQAAAPTPVPMPTAGPIPIAPAVPVPAAAPQPQPVMAAPARPQAFSSLALPAVLADLDLPAKPEKSLSRKAEKYSWQLGDLSGTAVTYDTSQPFLSRMLDVVDGMEKSCKTGFTSDLGAPIQHGALTYAEVLTNCREIQKAVLFYQVGGKFTVFSEQGPSVSRSQVLQRRENLKNDLLLSTNYK